jgi:hypothetical protein
MQGGVCLEDQLQITPRQAIKEIITEQPLSLREISQRLSLSEKQVLDHLSHIARAPGPGSHFQIIPAACKQCGFVFTKRDRLSTPSRCPICRGQSIRRPRYAIIKGESGLRRGQDH